MTLEVGDKIGTNRYGIKTDFTPEVGDRLLSFGNRAVSTKTLEVGDRFAFRNYGYKSSGETRTTCWNSIGQLILELGVSTATIHQDYTDNKIFRYLYNRYDGQYGDAYATIQFYPKTGKRYVLGTVSAGVASSAMTAIPNGCDIYLFVNGDLVDFILHNEYGVSNTKRFGGLDEYLNKSPGGGYANTVSLYIRPYDGITTATEVVVDLLENDDDTCLSLTRQSPGYYVTNAWKVNDAASFTAPWVNWVVGDPKPWMYDEYSLTFTAREGCIYTLMDFWEYSNVTTRPYKSYTAAYGYQWRYPWCAFNRTTPDYFGDPTYYSLAMWLNNGGTNWILTGNPCILTRGYNPYLDQVYVGYDDNFDRLTTPKGLVIGENYFVVRYPYYYSTHWVDNYWHTSGDSPSPMEYSALYLVELTQERIL